MTPGQLLRENQTLVSENKSFILGFFSGSSGNRYLGIWHVQNSIQRVIWVANRERPLTRNDSIGVFKIDENGNLLILDGRGRTLWSARSSSSTPPPAQYENWIALLQNSGSLVVSDGDGRIVWRSSDQPPELAGAGRLKNGRLHLSRRLASGGSTTNTKKKIAIAVVVPFVVVSLGTLFLCLWWSKRRGKEQSAAEEVNFTKCGKHMNVTNLPMLEFEEVAAATNGFAIENKLGKGGFGIVYKGMLPDGQEVAVKRLSKKSCQGLEEFTNEVHLIADVQHSNLVKIVACCVEEEEKILIYEYMPNGSLDTHLFDPFKRAKLDWQTRLRILSGIARGLLYLHCGSGSRIIHRDLKASNVLLDAEMNPKISDFGMAKIVGNQLEEYAKKGVFSEKTDVFSFGVLVLEVVTGKKNSTFTESQNSLDLLGHAWEMWSARRGMELVDPLLGAQFNKAEVERCMHIGLLCVQEGSCQRPSINDIIGMLQNADGSPVLQQPKRPASYLGDAQPTPTSSSRPIDQTCSAAFFLCSSFCHGGNALSPGQPLKDNDIITSSGGNFTLVFFLPRSSGPSQKRYVGIWERRHPLVWVANRDNPVPADDVSGGSLELSSTGDFVLLDRKGTILWSMNCSSTNDSFAVLEDKGNLVLRSNSSGQMERFRQPFRYVAAGDGAHLRPAKKKKRVASSSGHGRATPIHRLGLSCLGETRNIPSKASSGIGR
ncbi:L-type lectin-domain containing receptor kinase I-3 [Nymphaea thermarum]|nr:L-type lectin-domain containing receptor kinase I-3 [Nymphaea thermarum]